MHTFQIVEFSDQKLVLIFPNLFISTHSSGCIAPEKILQDELHLTPKTDYRVFRSKESKIQDQIEIKGLLNIILACNLFLNKNAHLFFMPEEHRTYYRCLFNGLLVKAIQEKTLTETEHEQVQTILKEQLDDAFNELQALPPVKALVFTETETVGFNVFNHPFYQLLACCVEKQNQEVEKHYEKYKLLRLAQNKANFATKIVEHYNKKGLIPSNCVTIKVLDDVPQVDLDALLITIRQAVTTSLVIHNLVFN